MGFGFRKSMKIGGARLNIGKKGFSVSTGVKGFRVSTGTSGSRVSVGTGSLRYSSKLGTSSNKRSYGTSQNIEMTASDYFYTSIFLVIVGILLLFVWVPLGLFIIGSFSIIALGAFIALKICNSENRSAQNIETIASGYFYTSIFFIIVGILLLFVWIPLGLFIVGSCSIIALGAFIALKTSNSENGSALENEILAEIEECGENGILQTTLVERYYLGSPSKSTIYQAIRNLENDYKIWKIKEGRTYRIKKV